MGIVFRQSVKTVIVTAFGAILGALILYLSARLIPQQKFGFSKYLLTQALVGSQFILMGIHSTLYVFIYRYPQKDERKAVLITLSILVPVILTLLCSIGYFLLRTPIIAQFQAQDKVLIEQYFNWLPFYVLLWGMITLFEAYLNSQMKIAVTTLIKEVILRVLNIALVLLYGFNVIDFHGFMIGSILVHCIPVALLVLLSAKTESFSISFNWRAFNKEEYKGIADFTFFHLLVTVSITVLGNVDILMIPALDKSGMVSTAVYAMAIFVISVFLLPYRAMVSAATPMINKAYEANEKENVQNLFTRAGINIMIVSTLMAVLIICNLNNMITVLGEGYKGLYWAVLILIAGRYIDAVTGLNTEVLSISKYYRYNFYFTFFLIVLIVGLNFFLIPLYGIYGAALSTSIALTLFNIAKLILLRQKMSLYPFTQKSLLVVIAGIVAWCIGYILPYVFNVIADTIVRSLVIIITYLLMLYWFKPSEDLKGYFRMIKENKRLF